MLDGVEKTEEQCQPPPSTMDNVRTYCLSQSSCSISRTQPLPLRSSGTLESQTQLSHQDPQTSHSLAPGGRHCCRICRWPVRCESTMSPRGAAGVCDPSRPWLSVQLDLQGRGVASSVPLVPCNGGNAQTAIPDQGVGKGSMNWTGVKMMLRYRSRDAYEPC